MTPTSLLEIEQKFRVTSSAQLLTRIAALPISAQGHSLQHDHYFAHPSRDFRHSDEALRIRYADDRSILTYKGPKLGGPVKSREELEWIFPSESSAAQNAAPPIRWLLERLGFQPIAVVSKKRQWFRLIQNDTELTISVDEVEQLGCFVEIETVCSDGNRERQEQAVLALARQLELTEPVQASYLGMLLKK